MGERGGKQKRGRNRRRLQGRKIKKEEVGTCGRR